jgi:hypothetical protein
MPKDAQRHPMKFPVWMQLGYANALKEPGCWVKVFECWTERMADSEMRGFRAFRRSARNQGFAAWAQTIRPDAQEFVSQARVTKEQVVHQGWAKVRHTIEVRCVKGEAPEVLRDERAEQLLKFGDMLGLGDEDLPSEDGK